MSNDQYLTSDNEAVGGQQLQTEPVPDPDRQATQQELETLVMALRWQRYVLGEPVISQWDHDELERKAQRRLPASSVVHCPASDRNEDYTDEQRALSRQLVNATATTTGFAGLVGHAPIVTIGVAPSTEEEIAEKHRRRSQAWGFGL